MTPPAIWLTGRSRYRVDENAKLILQVEEGAPMSSGRWRDATVEDLSISNAIPKLSGNDFVLPKKGAARS